MKDMRKSYKNFLDFEMDMLRDDFLELLEFTMSEKELSELTQDNINDKFKEYMEDYYATTEL